MAEPQTHYRICPLCEACCGLEIKTEGEQVISIRGAAQDVFSHGYICPKGVSLTADVVRALSTALGKIRIGNPASEQVDMGDSRARDSATKYAIASRC